MSRVMIKGTTSSAGKSLMCCNYEDQSNKEELEINKLANGLRKNMDMEYIYKIMGVKNA